MGTCSYAGSSEEERRRDCENVSTGGVWLIGISLHMTETGTLEAVVRYIRYTVTKDLCLKGKMGELTLIQILPRCSPCRGQPYSRGLSQNVPIRRHWEKTITPQKQLSSN